MYLFKLRHSCKYTHSVFVNILHFQCTIIYNDYYIIDRNRRGQKSVAPFLSPLIVIEVSFSHHGTHPLEPDEELAHVRCILAGRRR